MRGDARQVTGSARNQRWERARGRRNTRRDDKNASNPTIGSGMQQARKSLATVKGGEKPGKILVIGGENRRGRAKRRGRNAIGAAAPVRSGGNTAGRRTPGMRSMKGNGSEDPTNPRRGGRKPPTGADGPGRQRCRSDRQRSEAHEGRCSAARPQGRVTEPVRRRETSKIQPGDRQG